MTMLDAAAPPDLAGLFAPAQRRSRTVDWQEPGPVARAAMAMSGLEVMQAIRDGRLPPPPLARLIGFKMAEVHRGRIVMQLDPDQSLENTAGLLHGAIAAALLDTAMGCAISTQQPAGQGSVTMDLKLSYLRPLSVRSGTIVAEGRVVKLGRQSSYTEGFVYDGAGKLAVHATATFAMLGAGPAAAPHPHES
ncbi:PaaI family thioesterase [Rhodopseudomonas palustris]|uniref:PaaI family thioesterase n=1 Tax=Rhodopseudomonas palustris TaxID=1076 RepID=UPI000CEC2DA5|nr:PaaI family thioesterase [Rhodopseudomonas palustris]PPQ44045.1 phenylacetic acid degradation protein [Rhodopseudomonas palustris]